MTPDEVLGELRAFVARELLDGRDAGLDEATPLLEWGVIDSISLVMVLGFIRQRFGVEVPSAEVAPRNVQTLRALTDLVLRLRGGPAPPR